MATETIDSLIAKKDAIEAVLDGIERWVIFFGILVVIGVGGETVYGIRAWWNNRKLHAVEQSIDGLRQAEIARLTASGESLQRDVRGADARIAEAQRGAAEANERAMKAEAQVAGATAEAAKANLELAKLKTPRTLSKEQLDRIRSKVGGLAGTPFDLWVNMDSDSTSIMYLLDEVLRSAGWVFTAPSSVGQSFANITFDNKAMIMASSGVIIEITEANRGRFTAAASILTSALISEGIPAVAHATPEQTNKNNSVLHVMIGSKPLN